MRRLAFSVVIFCTLLSITYLLRGADLSSNMSFTRLLSIFSRIDLDFEHTLESLHSLNATFLMPSLPVVDSFADVFTWIYSFITYILRLCVDVIGSLVSFIRDILTFIIGILDFFDLLVHPNAVS